MPREYRTTLETREYVLNAIAGNPGKTVPKVAFILNLDESTVRRHVEALAKIGKVSEETLRGKRRLFVRSSEIPNLLVQKLHAVHAEEDLRKVFEALEAEGTTATRMARRLGISRARVVKALQDLQETGFAEKLDRYLWRRNARADPGGPHPNMPDA